MVAVVVLAACFQWWLTPARALYIVDSITYVGGAQSLAEGRGYRWLMVAGNPACGIYPPLQSVYLTPAWWLNPHFPENQMLIKGLMVGLWAATMGALFAVLRKGGATRGASALVSLAVGTNGGWAYYLIHAYSDILFAGLSFAVLWWWLKPAPRWPSGRLAATGLVLALMYLTRSATLGFLPGAVGAAAIVSRRQRSWKPVVLITLPLVVAVVAWALAPKDTVTYGQWLEERFHAQGGLAGMMRFLLAQSWAYVNGQHLLNNLSVDLTDLLAALAPENAPFRVATLGILRLLGIAFILTGVYGAWRSPDDRPLQAAVGGYLLEVILWPYPLGFRVLLPVLPLVIVWGIRGAGLWPATWWRWCGMIGMSYLGLCLAGNLAAAPNTRRTLDQSQEMAEAEATGAWMAKTIPASARVASHFDLPLLHLHRFSGHPIHSVASVFGELQRAEIRFDYFLAKGRYPPGKTIRKGDGIQIQVVWTSAQGSYQVLQVGRVP